MPDLGYGGSLGLAEESTWGTAVARTNWLRAYSLGLERDAEWQERQHLGSVGAPNMISRSKFQISSTAGGPIEVPAAYDDSTVLLLKHGLGKIATTGTDPYEHVATLGMPDERPVGLTIEQINARRSSGYRSEVFAGCLFSSFFLRQAVGEVLRIGGELIAKNSAARGAAGAPTYHSGGETPILHHQCSTLSWNSSTYTLISWEVQVQHQLDRRMLLGDLETARPIETNRPEVTLQLTLERVDDSLYTGHLAGTESDAVITYTGAGDLELEVTLEGAYISEYSDPVDGQGIVQQTLTMRPIADSFGLRAKMTNNNASATAN